VEGRFGVLRHNLNTRKSSCYGGKRSAQFGNHFGGFAGDGNSRKRGKSFLEGEEQKEERKSSEGQDASDDRREKILEGYFDIRKKVGKRSIVMLVLFCGSYRRGRGKSLWRKRKGKPGRKVNFYDFPPPQ